MITSPRSRGFYRTTPATEVGTVYILLLSQPLGDTKTHHAQFYTGFSTDADLRFDDHAAGYGAKFTAAAREKGISLTLIYRIDGVTRDVELAIKKRGAQRWLQKNAPHVLDQFGARIVKAETSA